MISSETSYQKQKDIVNCLRYTILRRKKTGKVVYAQYHRGYKDKGSLRLPSDFHGIRPYKDKEDRRHLVQHPLLQEDFLSVEDGA